jgi:hypothetical protein
MQLPAALAAATILITQLAPPNVAIAQNWTQWSDERRNMVDLINEEYDIKTAVFHGNGIRHVYLQKGTRVYICIDSFSSPISLACSPLQQPRRHR